MERLAALRDELLADECAPDRAARLAAVFESEARAWSQVYELSQPAAGLAGGAGRGGRGAGERGAVGAARRRGAGRLGAGRELGCRSGGCAPPGGPHHERRGGWSVMDSVGALILFSILGAVICAKARVAGGAVVFSLIALVLFVSTPAGSGAAGGGVGVRLDRRRRRHPGADRRDRRAAGGRGPRRWRCGGRSDERRRSARSGCCPQGRAGRGTAVEPPAAAGPVGPRRSTAGLPVKGARCAPRRCATAWRPPCDREPRRPCTRTPYGGGVKRPAAPAGPARPAHSGRAVEGGAR